MDPVDEVRGAIEGLFDAILRKNIDAIQAHYLQEDRLFIFLEGLTALDIINQIVLPSRFKTY